MQTAANVRKRDLNMDPTYISTQRLIDLGGCWKGAVGKAENGSALKRWGLVGFRLSRNGNHFKGSKDGFALNQSFRFCAAHGIPIAQDAEARLINGDPRQGGLDFFAYEEPLDALIFSWIPVLETVRDRAWAANEVEESGEYTFWVSPHFKRIDAWQKTAVRLGAKAVFIAADTNDDLNQKQFEFSGSPYRTVQAIPPDAEEIDIHTAHLAVCLHQNYQVGTCRPVTPNPPGGACIAGR